MPKENHYAVVVGVDQYPRFLNGKKNLNCPMDDARAVRDWLLRPDGGNLPVGPQPNQSPNLTLITREVPNGRQPPCPVVDEILKAIRETAAAFHNRYSLLDDQSKAEMWGSSRLYLYLSGHGIDVAGSDAVLLGANAEEGLFFHLSVQGIVDRFKLAKTFRELVVWTDCCRTASGIQIAPALIDLTPYQYEGVGNVQIFFARASMTQQPAYEPPADKLSQGRNSFFTRALLEGLGGGVVGAAQGIRPQNLKPFLKSRVPALSRQYYGVEQSPDITPDDDMEFVAGKPPTEFPVRLKIGTGSPFTDPNSVRVFSGIEDPAGPTEYFPTATTPGVFEFSLPNGLYVVTRDLTDQNTPAKTFYVRGAAIEQEI